MHVARPRGQGAGGSGSDSRDSKIEDTPDSQAPWPGAAQPAALLGAAILGSRDEEGGGDGKATPEASTITPAGILGWATATAAAVVSAGATATAPLRGWAARLAGRRLSTLRAAAVADPANPDAFAAYAAALLRSGRAEEVVAAVEAPAWPPAGRPGDTRAAAGVGGAGPAAPPPHRARAPLNAASAATYLRALDRAGALGGSAPAGARRRPPLADLLTDVAARADASQGGGATPSPAARTGSASRPLHIVLSDGEGGVYGVGSSASAAAAARRGGVAGLLGSLWAALVLASLVSLGFATARRVGGGGRTGLVAASRTARPGCPPSRAAAACPRPRPTAAPRWTS